MASPTTIAARWRPGIVLKRDVFSTVERGHFLTETGEVEAVLRRLDEVPWWSFPLAKLLFNRERRALARIAALGISPPLLAAERNALIRGWINGVALHIAKPHGDRAYFIAAKAALRCMHRAGICHNDLAKEQNWLRGADGKPYLTDFQLAAVFARRGRTFRIAAYEDLRHLLKHKRRYVPEALTARERVVLGRKSMFTRVWMATGKKVYRFVTRDVLRFTDREGGGPRLVNDAPRIADRLRRSPGVTDVAIVAYPDRRAGVGLYAFVEGATLSERMLRDAAGAIAGVKAPELLQVADHLPRDAAGDVRTEILQLVAMNQVDQIDPLLHSDQERHVVARIVAERRNLRDRFAF